MDKRLIRVVSVLLICIMVLSISLPVLAASGTTIEFKIQLGFVDANRFTSTKNKAFQNHKYYAVFQGEEIELSLSASDYNKLKAGGTVTKRIQSTQVLPDGRYSLTVKHGRNGKPADPIYFEVKNGEVIYERNLLGTKNVLKPALNLTDPATGGSIDSGGSEKDASHYSLVDRDLNAVVPVEEPETIWTDPDAGPETYWGNVYTNDGIFASLFAELVRSIMYGFWSLFGLHDPVTLIFGVSPDIIYDRYSDQLGSNENIPDPRMDRSLYVSPDKGFLYMFNEREYQMIYNVMTTFEKVLQIPYAIAIAIVGLMLLLKGFSAEERSTAKVLLMGILLYPIFIKFFPYLFEPIFWLNDSLVRAAGSVLTSPQFGLADTHALTRPFVTILIGSGTSLNALGVVIATLVLFIITAVLNFQYFVRRFMLALLIMMFPIVAFLQIFPGTRQTFRLWWSEFTANLFLQAAHAFVYVMFVSYVYHAQLPFVPIVAMLVTLSTLTVFVRNLMGCHPGSGVSGMIGGMMGISALMGASKIASGIVGGLGRSGRWSDEAPSTVGGGGAGGGTVPRGGSPSEGGGLPGIGGGPADGIGPIDPGGGGVGQPGAETVITSDASAADTGLASTATVAGGTPPSDPSARVGELSKTGVAWGLRPRMETVNWRASLAKATVGAGVRAAAFAGSIVGGAAMGPAGFGIGAWATTAGMAPIVRAGDRLVGIYANYKAREQVIQDVMERRGLDWDHAAVFAATGVEATPEEIQYDNVLREQYNNFMNITGFGAYGYLPDPELPPETVEEIRLRAARERERYMEQNPGTSAVQLNQHILEQVIRPALDEARNSNNPENNNDNSDEVNEPPFPPDHF